MYVFAERLMIILLLHFIRFLKSESIICTPSCKIQKILTSNFFLIYQFWIASI